MKKSKYYKKLNLIRFISCLAILLYHLSFLPGGYLAVCTFFVLSGYLACISAFKTKKFSLKDYYKNRIIKIYLPLLIVVLLTIGFLSFFPKINWLNLKPESTSVLLGYNNFWQLSVNLDYFARHVSSPFMHFWYLGILLQFELVFPFIFIPLRRLGDKFNKKYPCIIAATLAIISFVYFCFLGFNQNIMGAYYNTFARSFSLLFGVSLGFIHSYYKSKANKSLKKKPQNKRIFFLYIILLIIQFIFIDASTNWYILAMFATTLISCRLIDYATVRQEKEKKTYEKIIQSIAQVSYEIYLVQYPIIFFFQNMNLNVYFKTFLVIGLTFCISYLIHFCLNLKKNDKINKYLKVGIICLLFISCSYGMYQYIITKDHTSELKELEKQLNENELLIKQKQEEYASLEQQENEDWLSKLMELENDEKELETLVKNSKITGVGDSVMLGAVENLYKTFPKGYFDAKVSRTAWVANDILQDLKNKNLLGDSVILNLGANGDCSNACKEKIINTIGNRNIFWLTVTNDNDVHINETLKKLATKHENIHIIDWASLSKGHDEYFVADGIHLTESGKKAYTKAIFDAIYQTYLDEYNSKKEEMIKEHEEKEKNKITFWGKDVLLNVFKYIESDFQDAKFVVDSSTDFNILKENINNYIKNEKLNHKILFSLDSYMNLSELEYKELIELCADYKIYILFTKQYNYEELEKYENVEIINFYEEIENNNDYLMNNKIHLSEKGNEKLKEILNNVLKI